MGIVAAVQMCSDENVAQNLSRILDWIAEASRKGAKLVVFPENCLYFGPQLLPSQQLAAIQRDAAKELTALPTPEAPPSFSMTAPELMAVQRACDAAQIDVVLGSIPEALDLEPLAQDRPPRANTLVMFFANEATRPKLPPLTYRKMHLFDVTLHNGESYNESANFQAGTSPVTAHSKVGHLGLSICYDVRFPELYRVLVDRGAQILLVPAAFTAQTGKDHWHLLLRTRAVENLAYVVAPAQAGSPYPDRQVYGHSLIVDPWGNVLAQATDASEQLLLADLNLDYQRHIRQIFPVLSHRKLFTAGG